MRGRKTGRMGPPPSRRVFRPVVSGKFDTGRGHGQRRGEEGEEEKEGENETKKKNYALADLHDLGRLFPLRYQEKRGWG